MLYTTEIFIVLFAIALKCALSILLERLNASSVRVNALAVPDSYKNTVGEGDYFKSVSYTLDKIRFSIFEDVYSSLTLGFILVLGIFPLLFRAFLSLLGASVWGQSFAMFATMTIVSLFSLPTEYYSQFVVEERYGFNKSSIKLWVTDKIKELIIGMIIGVPLLALVLWFFGIFPDTWWLWTFFAVAIFQLVMLVLYPRVIMPLFNKFSPLEEGELKTRLLAMSDKAGFKADAIFVIDGSKRSSHSNAFFTGFGKFRRIVLFDTLINQLTPAELEAVLAHEIGHYKLGHIPRMILKAFTMLFVGLFLLKYLAGSAWFYEGFGFSTTDGIAPALLLFTTLSGLFTFYLTPLSNISSRKYEYQADAFAKKVCGTEQDLISALYKLHTKNLGNLTPHKIYSAVYYSHPTLLEREAALKAS